MATWIRTDVYFGDRARMLVIPYHAAKESSLFSNFQNASEDIGKAAEIIDTFIRIIKPELADGYAWAIEFDLSRKVWKIIYCHKSFARIGQAQTLPEMMITIDDLRKEHAHA